MKYLFLFFILLIRNNKTEDILETNKTDIAKLAFGKDIFQLENFPQYVNQTGYKFEDFFWTGSGDGSYPDNDIWNTIDRDIIYRTSTVTSTVYIETSINNSSESTDSSCTINCHPSSTETLETNDDNNISPTPTYPYDKPEINDQFDNDNSLDADRQFWIITILKSDGKEPLKIDLKKSLSKLYKVAFERHQYQHLGLIIQRQKRTSSEKPVNVHIHNVEKKKLNGDDKIEVIYHVEVLGKPVDALTATNDMKLVTDDEVQKELGYPFLIKAEPYLKASSEPLELSNAKSTWFFIGISIIGVLLVLLVVAFLLLGCTKRNRQLQHPNISAGIDNRRQIFERGVGYENKGLVEEETEEEKETFQNPKKAHSPTYINFGDQKRPKSLIDIQSSGTSSSSSTDILPLMHAVKKPQRKTPPHKPPRPRAAALNKTVPLNIINRPLPSELFDSDSSRNEDDDSADTIDGQSQNPKDTGIVSPKSFLSMPSVRSFPRSSMPEPLTKVLQPVSVTHLDIPDDNLSEHSDVYRSSMQFMRHGSVGTVVDPGVIGPAVWHMHCERLKHGVSVDQGMNDLRSSSNIGKMRKRLHDLLDDTFSLFGSRRDSPSSNSGEDRARPIAIEVKSHSATDDRSKNQIDVQSTRPHTTGTPGSRSVVPSISGPHYGAWSSSATSPLERPVSAAPRVYYDTRSSTDGVVIRTGILKNSRSHRADGGGAAGNEEDAKTVKPSESAISVIEAIKNEIDKVSVPRDTRELNK